MTDTLALPTVPRVKPIVEIGVGSERDAEGIVALWQQDVDNNNVPDVAGFAVTRWQPPDPTVGTNALTSHWVGDQPFYIDISCHIREVSTFTGRERADETWEVGTATIVCDNADGWADYPIGDPDQLLSMRPGREVRVGVLVDGTTAHYLWGGFVDGMEPGFDPEDGEFVTFECIDAKGEAGRSFLGELAVGVGGSETGTARVNRILNAVGWFNGRRDVATTSVQLQATTFDDQAVDLLDIAADSVGGAVFGDVNGKVAFRGRDWQATSVTAEPDGVIGNMGDGVCPVNWEQSFNREDIATKVVVGRPDEVPFAATNTAAFRLYGDETFERTDLETRLDADLVTLRDRILEVRSPTYMPRIAAVTLDAGTDPGVVDLLAAVTPFKPSIVYCKHRGVDGRTVFNKAMMVVGVEHTLSPEGWSARLALDNAKPFQIGASDGRWSDGTAVTARWNPTEPAVGTLITRWSEGV